MFFNIAREKSGRPGQFCDVMMTYWTLFGPWDAVTYLHLLAHATINTVQWHNVLARALVSRELLLKGLGMESEIDVTV